MQVTLTLDGLAPALLSKYRPRCPILVLAVDAHVGASCNLHRGCVPFLCPEHLMDADVAKVDERLAASGKGKTKKQKTR